MSSISGIVRNSVSESNLSLFNNLSTASSKSSSTGNILGIDLAEYASITRGSYNKLVKAYYAKYGNTRVDSRESSQTPDEETTRNRTTFKGDADDLFKTAGALVSTGRDSLFKKVEKTDSESGVTTGEYDTDKIYKAVNSLVDSYNSLVEHAADSKDNAVLRQTLRMVNSASSNSRLLNNIGIKIGTDNKLSIDEESFKQADMSTVKTLFNGSGSFGAGIQSAASSIYMNTNNLLGNRNIYTSSGTLGNYSTGNLLDSLL